VERSRSNGKALRPNEENYAQWGLAHVTHSQANIAMSFLANYQSSSSPSDD
jgi:hypothetical protein